jgi:hypothetical protein
MLSLNSTQIKFYNSQLIVIIDQNDFQSRDGYPIKYIIHSFLLIKFTL